MIKKIGLCILVLTFGLILGTSFASPQQQSLPDTMPNGVAAGDMTQNSVVLWAHSTALGEVVFEYGTDENFAETVGTLSAEVIDSLVPVKVTVNDLVAGTDYFYRAADSAGNSVTGKFHTPAEIGTMAGLRFGVSGDWRGELAPYPSISNVADRNLDFFALIGDTIYADYASPDLNQPQALTLEDYHIKQNEAYSTRYDMNTFAILRSSMGVYVTIDDHEVTNDFAGGASPSTDPRFSEETVTFINETQLYQNGLQAFFNYNPIEETYFEDTGDTLVDGKPKLYRYRTFGSDAAMIVLDARSFRSEQLVAVDDITDQGQVISFMNKSLDKSRTMLSKPQLALLQQDLLDAQAKGITWKFIMVPEPMQNLGTLNAQDRFEGYAAERAEILAFINDNAISNVVFITADLHGTAVNNITYQGGLGDMMRGTHNPTQAFEVITGAIAFSEPLGPTVVRIALDMGFITQEQHDAYFAGSREEQEVFMEALANGQVEPLGYSLLGLQDAEGIDAELLQGGYLVTNSYGWTEFDIDADTQDLLITTYGIEPYTPEEIAVEDAEILSRTPEILSRFVVHPQ